MSDEACTSGVTRIEIQENGQIIVHFLRNISFLKILKVLSC